MSAKPTVATLAATVEQMAARIEALESQVEAASDGIAVQLVADLVGQRLEALIEKISELEATVSAQSAEIARAHGRLDSAREYLRTLRKPPPPARRAQARSPRNAASQDFQAPVPVEPREGLRIYTHAQGPREGQSFQYWKDGGKTTMVRVFGPGEDVTTGLPKAPCLPDDLPPPAAAPEDADLVCPF